MSEIRIRHWRFEVRDPYEAGHQLDEWEAQALNGLRRENIRNLIAPSVIEAAEGPEGAAEEPPHHLQLMMEELDFEYHFGRRRARTHYKILLNAIEEEARRTLTEQGLPENDPRHAAELEELRRDKALIERVRQRLRAEARRVEETLADL